jgi:branched-chain amino acid transport system permease protein/neutral amino acid transport system permease protein
MISVHVLLKYTKFGKAMRATSANPSLARACGIHTSVVIDGAWAVSGILCGIAGVTLFLNTTSFSATTTGDFLVVIVAAAVLGGIGEAYGAMLGALVIGLATEIAAIWINPSYKLGVAFVALVVVLLVRPQGIKAAFSAARQVQA